MDRSVVRSHRGGTVRPRGGPDGAKAGVGLPAPKAREPLGRLSREGLRPRGPKPLPAKGRSPVPRHPTGIPLPGRALRQIPVTHVRETDPRRSRCVQVRHAGRPRVAPSLASMTPTRRMHMRTRRIPLAIAGATLALALVATACGGGDKGGSSLTGEIKVSGSSTVQPITSLLAEEFHGDNPDVQITVDGPGTTDGFVLFCKGQTDISDASRSIKDEEIQA